MSKNVISNSRKILALLIAVCLIVSNPISSLAVGEEIFVEPKISQPVSDRCIKLARDVQDEVVELFVDQGIQVADSTIVEVLPLSDHGDSVVCVTNFVDDGMKRDIVLTLKEESDGTLVVDNRLAAAISYNATLTGRFDILSSQGLIVTASGVIEVYNPSIGQYYYRPISEQFSYTNTGTLQVSSIEVIFSLQGYRYSYPNYSPIGSNVYRYDITKQVNNPVVGTVYRALGSFPSGTVMDTSTGNYGGVGEFFTFNVTAGGSSYSDTVIASH